MRLHKKDIKVMQIVAMTGLEIWPHEVLNLPELNLPDATGLIITHQSLVASHDEEHVGNVRQVLEAAPKHMWPRWAIAFARKEGAQRGNP